MELRKGKRGERGEREKKEIGERREERGEGRYRREAEFLTTILGIASNDD